MLLEHAGKDSTDAFEDIGHSSGARNLLTGFYIGNLSSKPEGNPVFKTPNLPQPQPSVVIPPHAPEESGARRFPE